MQFRAKVTTTTMRYKKWRLNERELNKNHWHLVAKAKVWLRVCISHKTITTQLSQVVGQAKPHKCSYKASTPQSSHQQITTITQRI